MRRATGAVILACLMAVAGCAAGSPHGSPSASRSRSSASPTAPTGPGGRTAQNVRASRALSERLLHLVRRPAGTRVVHRSPVPILRRPWVGIGPSDPALSRHIWWTVPMGRQALERWLRAHRPEGMRPQGPVGTVVSMGHTGRELTFAGRSTAEHTRPFLDLVFVPYGDGGAVRLTTFVGARFARTAYVPASTTDVVVRWKVRSTGPGRRVRTDSTPVTAPAEIQRLVRLVNRLPGSMTVPFVASCPARRVERTLRLTFLGPDGRWVVAGQDGPCWPRLTVRRNGEPVGPTLEPDRRFFRTVSRLRPMTVS